MNLDLTNFSAKRQRANTSLANPTAVGADQVLIDINIQSIDLTGSTTINQDDPTADIKHFISIPIMQGHKLHAKCKLCR